MTTTPTSCLDDDDCLNGGTCKSPFDYVLDEDHVNATSTSECICSPGFTGPRCQERCSIECLNGGQCKLSDDHGELLIESHYICKCPTGFSGPRCATSTTSSTTQATDADASNPSIHILKASRNESPKNDNSFSLGTVVGGTFGGFFLGIFVTLLAMKLFRHDRHHPNNSKIIGSSQQGDDQPAVQDNNVVPDIEESPSTSPVNVTRLMAAAVVDHDEEFIESPANIS